MFPDPWLKRWLPLIAEHGQGRPVLELGCGLGDDTSTLVAAGFTVHAIDLSSAAVAATQCRVPRAHVTCADMRSPFPLGQHAAGAVIASLSLHYFKWAETVELIARIRDTLAPNGVFLCRLNSTEDHNFGASGHPMVEPDYYLVNGQPKRFFNEAAIEQLFDAGWQLHAKAHVVTRKYIQSKALWEVVLQPTPLSTGSPTPTAL